MFEQQQSDDPLIGSQALCYYVAIHYKLSPTEVAKWSIPEVERWAAWASAADAHKSNEMEKESRKVESSSRSARSMGGRYR